MIFGVFGPGKSLGQSQFACPQKSLRHFVHPSFLINNSCSESSSLAGFFVLFEEEEGLEEFNAGWVLAGRLLVFALRDGSAKACFLCSPFRLSDKFHHPLVIVAVSFVCRGDFGDPLTEL